MSDWLLVRLARDGTQPAGWVAVSSSGELIDAHAATDAAGLAAAAEGRRVALVVPGTDVLQLAAMLPAGSESRLAQIVPFALEDQVSEELDALHFAVGHALDGPGTPTCVDVVNKALLERWLAVPARLGLTLQAVYADSELLPVLPGHVSAWIDEDTLTLRVDGRRPLLLPAGDPGFALELALGSDPEVLAGCHLIVYASSQDWAQHAPAYEALRARVATLKVQLLSGGVLPLFGAHLLSAGAINLLQGPYAPARSSGFTWGAWRPAAILAGVLLAVHLLASGLQLKRLTAQEHTLDSSIQQVFSQAMPGENAGTNGRKRMEQRLDQIRAGAPESGGLLMLLTAVSAAHGAAPTTHIEALSFRKGLLDLKVSGPDAESLEHMNQSLRGAGLASELASGSSKGQAYEGRLVVRSQGS
jgi:general secretion pathway protein L